MNMRRWEVALAAGAIAGATAAAIASETIVYRYDAHGRLVKVERSGTVNNGVITNYSYDKADNRANKTTTGSPNLPPP
jgi:YD repeat-containing protein